MKPILVGFAGLFLVLSLVSPASAAAPKKLGLGYFRPEAPVGGRLWLADRIAADLGIGFMTQKLTLGTEDKTKVMFDLDLGVPIVLAQDERSKFFLRPGFSFVSTPGTDGAHWTTAKDIMVSGSFGVEHLLSEKFSVQVAHGVMFKSHDSGVSGAKRTTSFATEDFGISSIGFHYYFAEL